MDMERTRRMIRAKANIGDVTVDPGDGSAPIPLEHVLIRGFTAMGWKLPATAAGDMLVAIAEAISRFR